MTGSSPHDPPHSPSTTEDVPAAPGWVEGSVEQVFAVLAQQPALTTLRSAYLDCLAGARGPDDIDEAHDRCRRQLIEALRDRIQVADPLLDEIDRKLEAIEAQISDET